MIKDNLNIEHFNEWIKQSAWGKVNFELAFLIADTFFKGDVSGIEPFKKILIFDSSTNQGIIDHIDFASDHAFFIGTYQYKKANSTTGFVSLDVDDFDQNTYTQDQLHLANTNEWTDNIELSGRKISTNNGLTAGTVRMIMYGFKIYVL